MEHNWQAFFFLTFYGLHSLNKSNLHVLYHNVLMWDQPIHTIMSPFPPVLRSSQVEQQRGSLLKGQLSWTSAHVVKFGYGFDLLQFCHMKKDQRKSHYFLCQLLNIQLLSSQWIDVFADSPSSLVLGPVPLSISSRAPGSLWGLSLERGDAEKEMKKIRAIYALLFFNHYLL